MPYKAGYEEDGFLKSLSPLKLTEIELLASNCTEVGFSFQMASEQAGRHSCHDKIAI
jgi:hypothetical protein